MKRTDIKVGKKYAVVTDGGHASPDKLGYRKQYYEGKVLEAGVMRYYNGSMRPVGFKVEISMPNGPRFDKVVKVLPAISFLSTWEAEVERAPSIYAQRAKNVKEARERHNQRELMRERVLAVVTALDPEKVTVDEYEVTLSLDNFALLLDDLEAKDRLLDQAFSQLANH